MKFLAVLLLFGLSACVLAAPIADDVDTDFDLFHLTGGSHRQGPILDRLKERFQNILDRMKKAVEEGKTLRPNFLKKAQDLFDKLKSMGGLSEKFKEMFENLKSKLNRGLAVIGIDDDSDEDQDEPLEGPILDRLRERFQNILNRMKKAIEDGTLLKPRFLKKAQDLFEKLKGSGGLTKKFRELFENLKSKLGKENIGDPSDDDDDDSDEDEDEPLEGPILDRLKERFQNILNRMKKAVEDGKPMKPRFLKKAQDLFEKLKGSGGLTKKFREMFENLKSKLGKDITGDPVDDDDSDDDEEDDLFYGPILDRLKERFQTIVDRMKKAVDEGKTVKPNLLKKAQDLFDKLKSMGGISEKMKKTFEDLRSKLSRGRRSVKEVWEKIKNYFKDLNIDLKEKFTKFGEWVKNQYEKGLEKGKDKLENVKRIAKEFLEDSKQISKDVAEEALEFFREYKEDLGKVFEDIKEKVKKTLKE